MKTRSFATDLLLLTSILCNASASCAAPTSPATRTPQPTETPFPTSTAEATPTPQEFVTAGSEWANLNVPVGLEIIKEGNVTYAVNVLGEKIEIGRDGKSAEWLKVPLAATLKDTLDNPELYMMPNLATVDKVLRLNAQSYDEGVIPAEAGDIISTKSPFSYHQLGWSTEAKNNKNKTDSIKLPGYYTIKVDDKVMYGRGAQILTDEGSVFLKEINAESSANNHPAKAIFPVAVFPIDGVIPPVPINAAQPNSRIMRDQEIIALLDLWIKNGTPPKELENFFLIFGSE